MKKQEILSLISTRLQNVSKNTKMLTLSKLQLYAKYKQSKESRYSQFKAKHSSQRLQKLFTILKEYAHQRKRKTRSLLTNIFKLRLDEM